MEQKPYEIFEKLSKSNKDLARIELSNHTGVTIATISTHWLSKKQSIPDKHIDKCLEIFTKILQEQIDGYQKLLNQKKRNITIIKN